MEPLSLKHSSPPGAKVRRHPVTPARPPRPRPVDVVELGPPPKYRLARAALALMAATSTVALTVGTGAAIVAAAAVLSRRSELPATLWEQPMRLGEESPRVERFQEALAHYATVPVTGVFDEATDTAVRAFQEEHGQRADGIVGERTLGVLFTRLFWEKGLAFDLNGPELAEKLPGKLRVVVDVGQQRLFVLDAATGEALREYPVSTGSSEFPTPLKRYKVTHQHEKPWWNPPPSEWAKGHKRTPPGPTNPLGPLALRLDGSSILIHGVPPVSFGSLGKKGASHGCIRMFPQHVWEISRAIGVGTRVDVVASSEL